MIIQYFPDLSEYPYESEEEQRESWLLFLDLCSGILIEQVEEGLNEAEIRSGSLLSHLNLGKVLSPDRGSGLHEAAKTPLLELFDTLCVKGLSDHGEPLYPLSRLLGCGLARIEQLALLMAISTSLYRRYERIYGLLQEEKEDVVRPTVGLCLDYGRLFLPGEETQAAILFSRESFLNRFLLKEAPDRMDSELSKPLCLRPAALSFALGEKDALGTLRTMARIITAPKEESVFHKAQEDELFSVLFRTLSEGSVPLEGFAHRPERSRRVVAELLGEAGSGRRHLAAMAAGRIGKCLLAVDMTAFFAEGRQTQDEAFLDAVFLGIFGECILYLWNLPDNDTASKSFLTLCERLSGLLGVVVAGTKESLPAAFSEALSGSLYRMELAAPDPREQKALWQSLAERKGISFEEGLLLDEIVSKYTMNPGRIEETLSNAPAKDGKVSREALEEQIRRSCTAQFGTRAARLASPFTWEDLMIEKKSERLLRIAADRIRFRKKVYEDFGFGKKLPYGRGVAIVFYGPPGTGKTMAAQVFSHELGLALYRIDLSQISSKYIGETEKNLGEVFAAAKNSNAVLFFDEADALFSKRTEVSSSNDKYANAETAYLLQKIEEYDGVSILATNNMQNFDAAFKRRMTYMIPIEAPGEETRRRLWEKVLPPEAPLSPEVDLRLLAQAVELSGAAIKSAALFAAFLAASEDRPIGYEDFVEAIDIECTKTGSLGMGEQLRDAILTGYQE